MVNLQPRRKNYWNGPMRLGLQISPCKTVISKRFMEIQYTFDKHDISHSIINSRPSLALKTNFDMIISNMFDSKTFPIRTKVLQELDFQS
jgi:hypothetical protein